MSQGFVAARYVPSTNGKSWTAQWIDINTGALLLGCEVDASKLCPITDFPLAGNGLRYTGTSGIFGTSYDNNGQSFITGSPTSQEVNFINLRMNNINECAKRGMRLPMITEMKVTGISWAYNPFGNGGANGVPSHPFSRSWTDGTSTISSSTWYNGGFFIMGLDVNSDGTTKDGLASGWNYVRCVR